MENVETRKDTKWKMRTYIKRSTGSQLLVRKAIDSIYTHSTSGF
jgi:hypothetical protein